MNKRISAATLSIFLIWGANSLVPSLGLAQKPSRESLAFGAYSSFSKIPDRVKAAKQRDEVEVVVTATERTHTSGGSDDTDPDLPLLHQVANSSMIVTGQALSRKSLMTADRSFLYSVYLVKIQSILKDSTNRLKVGGNVVIVRAGGDLRINGVKVTAYDPNAIPLNLDKTYLFIGFNISETTAFKVTNESLFDLSNASHVQQSRSLQLSHQMAAPDILSKIREFVVKAQARGAIHAK